MSQSQGVSKLKQILFDTENQALDELTRRVGMLADTTAASEAKTLEALKALSEQDERERIATRVRIEALHDRVGSPERLETSVAGIIDGALRRAETERHLELSAAMSPLVVRTVRTEIRNSRDELVEALYPMTGRMVKAYVASAMKDLMEQINRRLEQNPFMLRLAAFATGRSVAELALADSQRTTVEDLYLIRRGTGELVARWPQGRPGANSDQVMSGVLSALTEFTSEAFSDDGRALRQIDLGASQVYLRLSPAHLLAVRCAGSQHAAIEQIIDDEFLVALERHASLSASHPPGALPASASTGLLSNLSGSLTTRIAEKEAEVSPPRAGTAVLKAAAWMIGLPLLAWLTWSLYTSYETARVRDVASRIVRSNPDLKGYPTHLTVEPRGRAITISGLAPLPSAKDRLVADLRTALPLSEVRDQLAVVPSGLADAEPLIRAVRKTVGDLEREVDRRGVLSPTDRALRSLERLSAVLASADLDASRHGGSGDGNAVADASALVREARDRLMAMRARPTSADGPAGRTEAAAIASEARDIGTLVRTANERLTGLLPAALRVPLSLPLDDAATATTPAERLADHLAVDADRLAATVAALGQAAVLRSERSALDAEIAALKAKLSLLESRPAPQPAPEPSARERLDAWTRSHAIFFANGTEYRDGSRAAALLDELARLIKASDAVVRVVGYTDEIGVAARNSTLSQTRADTVFAALVARGVPPARLIALGRLNLIDIAPTKGSQSTNRRVEFEVGFDGETTPGAP